jgi:hypothetical protein
MLLLSFFIVTEAFSATYYVDTTKGKDKPDRGRKPNQAWKTITYAVQQTSIIETYEEVLIKVAAGTYNETITIDIRPVSLEATEPNTIIDGGSQNVITINCVKGVSIDGFTVQNGNHGIVGRNGAAFAVSNSTIQDNAKAGIRISNNSTAHLNNCTMRVNGDDGIAVNRNSSVTCTGTIDSNNNTGDGIDIESTSSAVFYEATINANSNGGGGIITEHSSSLIFSSSTLTAETNTYDGVGAQHNSSMSVFGSTVTANENKDDGVSAYGNSRVHLSGSTVTANENKDDGVSIYDSSSLSLVSAGTLEIKENEGQGLAVSTNSNVSTSSGTELTIRMNKSNGILVEQSSNTTIGGTVDVLYNVDEGVFVTNSANLRIYSSGVVTVAGTTGYATGIKIREGSAMLAWGATLEVKENIGIDGVGIMVLRNSHLRLGGTGLDAQIFNNGGHGIEIGQNSSGRFDAGTKINGNDTDGLRLGGNSMFYATEIEVMENVGNGITANAGSTVICTDCTISNNTGNGIAADNGSSADFHSGTICGNSGDIVLTFGSRGSFNNIMCFYLLEANCDSTSLIRGDIPCS